MKLQTHIRESLWLAVSKTYMAGSYSHAILDALSYITELLRERTGLNSDGHTLVGAALGGDSPRLRISKLQTQSERDAQRGLEQILRGLYWGVRNPRAHEKIQDTKESADAIIYFIDYLAGMLEESRAPFTINNFIEMVFDEHFYPTERYSNLLVSEIPKNKLLDTLIELWRRRMQADAWGNVSMICRAIYKVMDDAELSSFMDVVSSELQTIDFEEDFNGAYIFEVILGILSPSLWPLISAATKLRIEGILEDCIAYGSAYLDAESAGEAAVIHTENFILPAREYLGTMAREYVVYFDDEIKAEITDNFLEVLQSLIYDRILYLFHYFLPSLPALVGDNEELKNEFINLIANAVNVNKSGYLLSNLPNTLRNFPSDWSEPLKIRLPYIW